MLHDLSFGKKMTKKSKYSRSITFNIHNKHVDFINKELDNIHEDIGAYLSIGYFVREAIDLCWKLLDLHKFYSHDPDEQKFLDDLFNIKRMEHLKKLNDNESSLYKTINVRISDFKRKFIDDKIKLIREESGVNYSTGDFVRFCIKEYINFLENKYEQLKKTEKDNDCKVK